MDIKTLATSKVFTNEKCMLNYKCISSWWLENHPIAKYARSSKLDHFPNVRGENRLYLKQNGPRNGFSLKGIYHFQPFPAICWGFFFRIRSSACQVGTPTSQLIVHRSWKIAKLLQPPPETVGLTWSQWLLPWKLTCPQKRNYFNRKYIFQPSFFRGYVSFQGGS